MRRCRYCLRQFNYRSSKKYHEERCKKTQNCETIQVEPSIEHLICMECDENSCDLTPDVTKELISAVPNDVSEGKGQKFESPSTADENATDSLSNDLGFNGKINEKIMEKEEADCVAVESTYCNPVNQSCSEKTSMEKSDNSTECKTDSCGIQNHKFNLSANVNGFSPKRSNDDDNSKDEVEFKELTEDKSPPKKFFGTDSLNDLPQFSQTIRIVTDKSSSGQKSVSAETEKSSTDISIVDSCDKPINDTTNECQVNNVTLKSREDGCTSPALFKRKLDDSGDSDGGSGSSSCPKKRSIVDSENSSSCSEKRLKIQDSVVPDDSSCPEKRSNIADSENSSSCSEKRSKIEESVVPNGSSCPEKRSNIADSENSSSCSEKRSKIEESVVPNSSSSPENHSNVADSENSSSCSEKRSKIEDSVVPNGCSDCENGISATTDSVQQKKKITARKSTGKTIHKMITHLIEEECTEALLADAEKVTPVENSVDHSPTDFVDVNASSNEGRQSPVEDIEYPVKLTRESMSSESLKNVFLKMAKGLSRKQLEEIVLQKCCEVISDNSEIGKLKKLTSEAEETKVFRKNKGISIKKQLLQLKGTAEFFCDQVRLAKECGQIIPPKIITRSVGLQVSLPTASKTTRNPPSTRTNSVDEDDQRAPADRDSRITSSDAGQHSRCLPPTKSSRPSSSETTINEKNHKSSLPTNSSAASSNNNAVLPAKKNSSSETPAKVPPASSDYAIVDLTDLDDNTNSPPRPASVAPRNGLSTSRFRHPSEMSVYARHPAPLPPMPKSPVIIGAKSPPPKPNLFVQKCDLAIQMTWDLPVTVDYEPIEKYQIYAYQETVGVPVTASLWKSVGDVESLNLPMACILTQFLKGFTYHFAVRAVDKFGRHGAFSCAKSITL